MSECRRALIEPEQERHVYPGYAPMSWDYPTRCLEVETALTATAERVAEWDPADKHGWWHDRTTLIALHNEVVRLRRRTDLTTLRAEVERLIDGIRTELRDSRFDYDDSEPLAIGTGQILAYSRVLDLIDKHTREGQP